MTVLSVLVTLVVVLVLLAAVDYFLKQIPMPQPFRVAIYVLIVVGLLVLLVHVLGVGV